ncbi:MAG: PDZ domain-containing protein [Opitutus sp.]
MRAASPKPNEDGIVKLDPYVVETKSLANAGFRFKAKFHHHLKGAGIKELTIVEVGPQSQAKKAGLAVGEKILQIRDVKVEGLAIEELQNEFETTAVDGKVPLLIQARGSDETRTVVLQFSDPLRKKSAN